MRIHRIVAGVLGTVVGIAITSASIAQERKAPVASKEAHMHAQHYWDCAKACDDCARVCDACSSHCIRLVAEGKKDHLETVQTCQDCATICSAAATITARTGPYSDAICTACAEVCKRCGDACEKFKDDPMMKNCTAECRKCEKACREMLKHTGHNTSATSTERR